MNARTTTERILDAYLAPEADRLPDRVIDAALADIARTPQRRALSVPWRFPLMTNTLRAAAGIAIVAIVGVGIIALSPRAPGAGAGTSPVPSPTAAPTAAQTASPAPTTAPATAFPAASAPGIAYWTSYTSAVYGLTFGIPDGWSLDQAATRKWQDGDPSGPVGGDADLFVNPATRDGDEIAFEVSQRPAGSGADITSREGLAAWAAANFCDEAIDACETVPNLALPMCAGKAACLPAILVPLSDGTTAFIADAETDQVTIVSILRPDAFPAASRYGGAVQLLKSILTTMDVWMPEPGQIPSGG
jgi:hypothetical protein